MATGSLSTESFAVAQAGVGGKACHAEHAQPGGDRSDGRVDGALIASIGSRMALPARIGNDDIAFLPVRVT
jgi:hypothetical protein